MTAAAAPGTERVWKEFQRRDIEFLLIYVREAHPGETYPCHTSMEQKTRYATALANEEDIHAPVLIDDLEGTIHRTYGFQPNMLYVMDKRGRVVFRALWAEAAALRRALTELLDREQKGSDTILGENLDVLVPFLHGMAEIPRVLRQAGSQAVEDFRSVLGNGALLAARSLAVFRPLLRASPGVRLAVLGCATLAIMGAMFALLRRG